jgi:hypothetical protein
MKKIFLVAIVAFAIVSFLSSCGSSKKTGCPGTEGIIK